MLTNLLKRKVVVQTATITVGAVGQTVTWSVGTSYYARRVPLDVKTIAAYQDLSTVVTDKFIFRGDVDIRIGKHRIIDGAKTYEPASSAQKLEDSTVVVVRQT
jgi:hypothetical protein